MEEMRVNPERVRNSPIPTQRANLKREIQERVRRRKNNQRTESNLHAEQRRTG